jgi:ABC-type Fe3+/spermidine/putrescine transport system ATPase subunit
LLLDEPFSNLDAIHKAIIKSVIDDITATLGITCIMVSHDAPDTLSWANTILVMKDGRFIQQGTPVQIYQQPVNEYCAGLFGEYNLINAKEAAVLDPAAKTLSIQHKMLVRPEEIFINEGCKGLKATIQNIQFMGSYYTIHVTAAAQLIKINTSRHVFLPGETVILSISSGSKHYI